MNIKGLDKATVLMALYNAAKQLPTMAPTDPMTLKEAQAYLKTSPFMHTFRNRTVNISLVDDEVMTSLYNRASGDMMAERVINKLHPERPDNHNRDGLGEHPTDYTGAD